MSSQQFEYAKFYEDQVRARRQPYSADHLWQRLNEPTVIVSSLLLAIAILYQLGARSHTLVAAATSCGIRLWDALVYITPLALLDTIDHWAYPQSEAPPMHDTQMTARAAKSERMRRLLGLDRTAGMMASVLQARSRAFSATGNALGFKPDLERPAGLGNRDNSCYQNSILQGLAALRPLPDYLSSYLRAAGDRADDKDVAQTLRTLVSDLNDTTNNGRTLWTPSLLKSMSSWTQQDAQEYYSKILDDIDKGVARIAATSQRKPGLESEAAKDDTTSSQHSEDSGYQSASCSVKLSDPKPFQNPLEGLLAQRVACVQCGYTEGLSMIPFNCLMLSLGLDKANHDLFDRLDAFCNIEAIEGVECPKCTLLKAQRLLGMLLERLRDGGATDEQLAEPMRRLEAVEEALEEDDFSDTTINDTCKISAQGKVNTTKTKQIVIARPPRSLAIHVNRSVFDPSTFDMMKNSAPVRFPTTLDLGPWCLGSAEELPAEPGTEEGSVAEPLEEEEEQWSSQARASMVAGDLRPSRLTGPIYELRAAVTHYGRHDNGHYICYRKFPRRSPPQARKQSQPDNSANQAEDDDVGHELDDMAPQEGGPSRDDGEQMDWWRLSDQDVSKVDEQTVMGLAPGVFMLFYDCIDPAMILDSGEGEMQDVSETVLNGDAAALVAGKNQGSDVNEVKVNHIERAGEDEGQKAAGSGQSVDVGSRGAYQNETVIPKPTAPVDSLATKVEDGGVERQEDPARTVPA